MSPEIETNFEPFLQQKSKVKAQTGFSQPIGIIKSHGGFVNVYSEAGTRELNLRCTLPAVEEMETQAPKDL